MGYGKKNTYLERDSEQQLNCSSIQHNKKWDTKISTQIVVIKSLHNINWSGKRLHLLSCTHSCKVYVSLQLLQSVLDLLADCGIWNGKLKLLIYVLLLSYFGHGRRLTNMRWQQIFSCTSNWDGYIWEQREWIINHSNSFYVLEGALWFCRGE